MGKPPSWDMMRACAPDLANKTDEALEAYWGRFIYAAHQYFEDPIPLPPKSARWHLWFSPC